MTESEKNRRYYEKHREHICAVKHDYQMSNKAKIAQQRKERRIAKMKENKTAAFTVVQNIELTSHWWGKK